MSTGPINAGQADIRVGVISRVKEGLAAARADLNQWAADIKDVRVAINPGMGSMAGGLAGALGVMREVTAESRAFGKTFGTAMSAPIAGFDAGGYVSKFATRLGRVALAGKAVGLAGQAGFGLISRAAQAAAGVVASPFALIEGLAGKSLLGKVAGAVSANFQGLGKVLASPFSAVSGKFATLYKTSSEYYWKSWKLWGAGKLMGSAKIYGPAGQAVGAAGQAAGMGAAAGAGPAAQVAASAPGTVAAATGTVRKAVASVAAAPSLFSRVATAAASAGSALRGFGMQMVVAGGVAAAIAAPFALLQSRYSKIARGLAAQSRETGVAVETLSALRAAAQEAGVSADELADRIKKTGAEGAAASLGGTVAQLTARANAAGVLVTAEQAANAEAVAGAWKSVRTAVSGALDTFALGLGDAFAADLKDTAESVKAVVGAVAGAGKGAAEFLKENRDVATKIAAVFTGVAFLAAGAIAGGGALIFLGTALSSLGTVAAFILNPMTLLIAALAAGAAYWLLWTDSGQAAIAAVKAAFGPMAGTVKDTISGIKNALSAGELKLAAQIGFTGVKLAALQALDGLGKLLPESLRGTVEDIQNLLTDTLSGNWDAVLADLSGLWAGFCGGIVGLFTNAMDRVVALWSATVEKISAKLFEQAMQEGALGTVARTLIGSDPRKFDDRKRIADLTARIDAAERAFAAAGPGEDSVFTERGQVSREDLENLKSERARRQKGLDQGTTKPDAVITEATAGIAAQVAEYRKSAEDYLQALRDASKAGTDAARAEAKQRAEDARRRLGTKGFSETIAELERELAELNRQAAAAAAAAPGAGKKPPVPGADDIAGRVSFAGHAIGQFGAAGLGAALGLEQKGDVVAHGIQRQILAAIQQLNRNGFTPQKLAPWNGPEDAIPKFSWT